MLDNVPPGSIFQVFATKQKGVTAIELEGSRGLCYVLGITLSSILPLPLSLPLPLRIHYKHGMVKMAHKRLKMAHLMLK